jgi:hypothetical protein
MESFARVCMDALTCNVVRVPGNVRVGSDTVQMYIFLPLRSKFSAATPIDQELILWASYSKNFFRLFSNT